MGVAGVDAHTHGEKILRLGFSLAKCSDVVAFEVHPDDTTADQFNQDLASMSDGLIPPLAQLRLISVGGGHTNTFLRAVKAGCPTPVSYLQGQQGKISASLLSADKPLFKQALSEGLNWFVLDSRFV